MKKLVITEKSNAARRIATILSEEKPKTRKIGYASVIEFERDGSQYSVVGLSGHIIELDYPKDMNDWRTVDLSELVYTSPEKIVRAKSTLDAIDQISRHADQIIIATDYDREGELIGLETIKLLDMDMSRVKRARFSALTKQEIETAFENLTDPDERLAESAEARQIIDLAWGAVLTRFISTASRQVGRNFLSAGRVQSPTLALVVDRHREIEGFVPQPYWNIKADVGEEAFIAEHEGNPIWDEGEADRVMMACDKVESAVVTRFTREEKDEYPPAPFSTTMMLAEANRIGIRPGDAMKIAESLYTSGYISYPRTDNTVYPKSLSLRSILNKLKDSQFAKEAEEILAQERIRPSRGKRSTTDHPPIHPVGAAKRSKFKDERKWKLYELITRRFLATLAPSGLSEVTDCGLDVAGEAFKAEGYRILDPGWRRYYPYWKVNEVLIPNTSVGDALHLGQVTKESKETLPPRRFNQGSLIQEMERQGLGTKSTRHEIIGKLYDRKYAEGNDLIPTLSGIAVTEALERHARMITESRMTASLEEDMELIAEGEKELAQVTKGSQDMLKESLDALEEHRAEIGNEIREALERQEYMGKCPRCGNDLRIRTSRKGTKFVGCSNYPDCTQAYFLPRSARVELVEGECETCKAPMLRVIRRGQPVSIQCMDPDCASNQDRDSLGTCPKCEDGRIRMLYSRAGKRFAGCTNYPDCDQTYPLPQRGRIHPTDEACPHCGSPMIKMGKNAAPMCINMKCPAREKKGKKKEDDGDQ